MAENCTKIFAEKERKFCAAALGQAWPCSWPCSCCSSCSLLANRTRDFERRPVNWEQTADRNGTSVLTGCTSFQLVPPLVRFDTSHSRTVCGMRYGIGFDVSVESSRSLSEMHSAVRRLWRSLSLHSYSVNSCSTRHSSIVCSISKPLFFSCKR